MITTFTVAEMNDGFKRVIDELYKQLQETLDYYREIYDEQFDEQTGSFQYTLSTSATIHAV